MTRRCLTPLCLNRAEPEDQWCLQCELEGLAEGQDEPVTLQEFEQVEPEYRTIRSRKTPQPLCSMCRLRPVNQIPGPWHRWRSYCVPCDTAQKAMSRYWRVDMNMPLAWDDREHPRKPQRLRIQDAVCSVCSERLASRKAGGKCWACYMTKRRSAHLQPETAA